MLAVEMQIKAAAQKYVCPRCQCLLGPVWQVVQGQVVCKQTTALAKKSKYFDVSSRQFAGNKTSSQRQKRAREISERKHWTLAQRRQCAFQQKYCCATCQHLLPSAWEADHVIPLHLNGTNELSNCQILCSNCHATKTQFENLRRVKRQRTTSAYFNPRSQKFLGSKKT